MSLDYRKLHVGVCLKRLLAKATFVNADAPTLKHQKQYVALVKSKYKGNTTLLMFWTSFKEAGSDNKVYFLNFWSQNCSPYLSTTILNPSISVVNQLHLNKSVSFEWLGHTVLTFYRMVYGMR